MSDPIVLVKSILYAQFKFLIHVRSDRAGQIHPLRAIQISGSFPIMVKSILYAQFKFLMHSTALIPQL
jgi:hypothetical protein